ncbi:1,2-diacylglycerol 3-glucosyltransferase [Candidatus Vecturithrix granuli]|uniref:1,2-diacylglycerol 3-glucosyltransferase n=1 Tax=Vecturithrix granuli TaxID=1499967 RepID=A0A081BZY3_VECG1|nr:1,2-diacylglycerol 3-glucosyltransferase [Candidatus Vecturithrix granuli]
MVNTPANICLITGIFPPDIGGPATYVSRLATSLHQQGHKVCVVTLGDAQQPFSFPVRRVSRHLPLPLRLLSLFFTLLRYGRSHCIWYINGLELPAVLAGKLLRKRLVMKIVGDYAWERSMNAGLTTDGIDDFQVKTQGRQVELHKNVRAWLARQADKTITPSRYLKTLVHGWGVPEHRIQVIYNAVEFCSENLPPKAEIRAQLGVSSEDHLLITVGRLVAWKGIHQLIQLLPQLEESVKLLIVGDGPEKNRLTELAQNLSVCHRARFLGKVSRNQGFAYMKASDVFVLNTAYEGFSHVLLEAMMLGIPVITTSVCGNPELVITEKNGILVQHGNIAELQEQLERVLYDSELRKRLIDEGKCTIQRFSWKTLLRETLQALDMAD